MSAAGSSCPAIALGDGRMPLRMVSMMSGARLTKLNARKRKARSCLTFCASSETVATFPDSSRLKPVIVPKLIDQKEAAEMLGIGHSNFKRLESEGAFPFQRKMVGSAVRYRNTDIIDYIKMVS